ncbi:MAG: outer membrane protein assembly factor BamD, partial [Verrucomicrobiaceae bacterium]
QDIIKTYPGTTTEADSYALIGDTYKEMSFEEQNYDAVVYYRISRCFAQLNRFWEARLGFQWLYDNFPAFEDRPTVLFGLIVANTRLAPESPDKDSLKIIAKTESLCREYLKQHSAGANVQEVAEVLIAMVQKTKDQDKIGKVYGEVMKYLENSPNKAQFLAIQVQNYLEQYDFVKAREAAENFRAQVPDSPVMENIDYMYALTFFFQNDYAASIRELSAYKTKYPNGQYIGDARYRLAMMMKGEEQGKKAKGKPSNMKKVIDECQDIIKTYPGTTTEADSYALIGDTYKEMSFEEQKELGLKSEDIDRLTADAYMMGAVKGRSDAVVDYCLSQARPLLTRQGRWKEIEDMYQDFLKTYPDSPKTLEAISWIGKSIVRQGKTPEEKTANEEKVKKFLAEQVLENINNPSKEGVEDLLQQLAKSCIPKKKPRAAAAPAVTADPKVTTPATAVAAATPAPPPLSVAEQGQQAEAALDQLLGAGDGKLTNVGKARLVYVKSELYKSLERAVPKKKGPDGKPVVDTSPKQSDALAEKLATDFTAEDLSPRLLATVAEYHLTRGAEDRSATYYNRLIQFFPQSPYMDWGLTGLGEMAYKAKDYENALKRFEQAINDYPGAKYSQAVIGKARVLFDTEKYAECETLVKEMFGDKSVPKEVMAEATWLMGEIKYKQKMLPDAFNYFQRLYLSFKAFPSWMARGYLRAGQMKEEMTKALDAVAIYREAVNDPKNAAKLQNEPDFAKVRERLRVLGN